MNAADLELINSNNAPAVEHKISVMNACPGIESEPPRKRNDRGPCSPGAGLHQGVIEIQNQKIVFLLVHEYARLGFSVFLDITIAVKMVLGHIQDSRDPRPECLDVLKLETRKLGNDPVLSRELRDIFGERVPDISRHQNVLLRFREHQPHERRDRGLAVRAGNADVRRIREQPCKFELADHLDTVPPCLQDRGDPGHTRTEYDEVGLDEDPVGVASRNNGDAAAEGCCLRGKLVDRLFVRHRYERAECMERPRSSHPAPRHTDHRDLFAFEVRLHETSNIHPFLPQRSQRAQSRARKKKLKSWAHSFRSF